jgi:glyoxalase family protein
MSSPGNYITRHHHITIATGDAQQDYDFHTKVLGFKSVKKTAFYDGSVPIYHLYYGNDTGEESSLLTTFPVAHTGVKGRKGSGQISYVSLSIPPQALDYWRERLHAHGFEVRDNERFGERYLDFQHPSGVDYSLVAVADDRRKPHSKGPVPAELMIRGTHSIGVSTRDGELMEEFMQVGWGGRRVADDRNRIRYALGTGDTGTLIDFEIEPDRKPGTWTVAEGTVHHMAFQIGNHAQQAELKFHLEGIGYTDVSDVKDRGYFDSIYVRTPSGAMFEATVTHPDAFMCDEPADRLGLEVMLAPQLKVSKEEMLAQLGYLKY